LNILLLVVEVLEVWVPPAAVEAVVLVPS